MPIEHDAIPNAELHEPKGVSDASVDEVYVANGGGSGEWKKVGALLSTQELLNATSTAANQQPSTTDSPIQLELGAAQNSVSDPVMVDALGTITFNDAGLYRLDVTAHFGRSGSTGVSHLYVRQLFNGVQQGNTLFGMIDDSDVLLPFSFETWVQAPAGLELKYELVRDSVGNNSGGLFRNTPTLGWSAAPTISVTVNRVV